MHDQEDGDSKLSYAKQQLSAQPRKPKVLRLPWDKQLDMLSVTLTQNKTPSTKREVLKKLAKVYDPLGLATPLTLQGKLVYRDIYIQKLSWDTKLTRQLVKKVEN